MTRILAAFLMWYLRSNYGPESITPMDRARAERIAAEWLRSIEE